jgi:DNA-binding NtrC family response regulator
VQHIEPVSTPVATAQALQAAVTGPAAVGDAALLRPLAEQVAELERQAIQAALRANHGNKAAAAKMLGMARATLYSRLGIA